MENIGDREYGLSIDGDVFYTIPIVEKHGEIAQRFYEGFRENVSVLDVTDNLPVGIGWELDGNNFIDDGSGRTIVNNNILGQRFYAFIANNRVFGVIVLILSEAQEEMFTAAFSTGGVIGIDVTAL
jgi:hypothetical protein